MTLSRFGLAFYRNFFFGTICIALALLASSCSSSSSSNKSVGFTFTSPASGPTIDQGQTVNLVVNQPANWTLQAAFGIPKGTNLGSLSATSGSTSATYNACTPSASVTCLPNTQVIITAVSTTDPTQSASLTVVIPASPAITANSPVTVPCSSVPAGTVILGFGAAPFNFGWTTGVTKTYDLAASGGVAPYTWTVSSGTLPAGLSLTQDFTTNQISITGAPTSSTCADVTLQVTDAAGVSATSAYTLLVIPPPLNVQLPPAPNAYVGVQYPSIGLIASAGTPPYTWTADPNPGSVFPPGLTFSTPASNPNIAVVSGTPDPSGAFQSYTPAAFVHDSQTPYPASAHPGITLGSGQVLDATPACSNNGGAATSLTPTRPYAFLLRGFDSHGPVVIAGNFTVDGAGNVTGGAEDIHRSSAVQSNLTLQASSSYTLGPDNRGCLTLANSAGSTMTFQTAWGTCSTSPDTGNNGGCQNNGYFLRGTILLDDPASGTRASGILRSQDPAGFNDTTLSGLYAFGLSGWNASGGRYAVAGSASASSGTFTSFAADINDSGALGSNLTGGMGSYHFASSGRGTATISVGSANLGFVAYPVSGGEVLFATSDALDATHSLLSGEALSSMGAFTAQNFQNSYIVRTSGVSAGTPDVGLGVLTLDGGTAVSGTLYENSAATLGTTSVNATYAVDANTGRLLFTALLGQNLGPHPLVGYAASPGSGVTAFVLSTDGTVQFGVMEFQAPNPPLSTFSNSSFVGARFLGTDEDMDAATNNASGTLSADGNGHFKGIGLVLDESFAAGAPQSPSGLQPNVQFNASYSVGKNGGGNLTGQIVAVTSGTTMYLLDQSPLDLHPAILVIEQ